MKWLLNALSSSVGKKFVMAITGLLLCGFLVVHLAGNLLLYVGPEAYDAYAHKLHDQAALLLVAEVGLFALFILHIVLAVKLTLENRTARGRNYAVQQAKGEGDGVGFGRPDSWMMVSGIVIFLFLVLHLSDFKFQLRDASHYAGRQPFEIARSLLRTPLTSIGYVVGVAFLMWHLFHGVSSAFQSLGINHKKYTPLIRVLGVLFAVAIGVGFASFPLVWAFMSTDSPAPVSAEMRME